MLKPLPFFFLAALIFFSFESQAGRAGGASLPKTAEEVQQSQQAMQEHGGCDPGYQQMIEKAVKKCEDSVSEAAKDCDQSCFQAEGGKGGEACTDKQKKVECQAAQGQAGSDDYKASLKAAAQCHRDQAAVYGEHKAQCNPHKKKISDACKPEEMSFSQEIINKCADSIRKAKDDVGMLRDKAGKRVEDSVFDDELSQNLAWSNAREADANANLADGSQGSPAGEGAIAASSVPHCNEDGICPAVGYTGGSISELRQREAELNRFTDGTKRWTYDEHGNIASYEADRVDGAIQKTSFGGNTTLQVVTPDGQYKDAQRFQTVSATGGIVNGVRANDGSYSVVSTPSSPVTISSAAAPNFSRGAAAPAASAPAPAAPASSAPATTSSSSPASAKSSPASQASAPSSSSSQQPAAAAAPQPAAQPQQAAAPSGGTAAPSSGPRIAGTSAAPVAVLAPTLDSRLAAKDIYEAPELKKAKAQGAEAVAKSASTESSEQKEEVPTRMVSLSPRADIGGTAVAAEGFGGGNGLVVGASEAKASKPTARRPASPSGGSWSGSRGGLGSRVRSFASWATGGRVSFGGDEEAGPAVRATAIESDVDLARFLPDSAAISASAEGKKVGGLGGSLNGEPVGKPDANLFAQAASRYKALETTLIDNP